MIKGSVQVVDTRPAARASGCGRLSRATGSGATTRPTRARSRKPAVPRRDQARDLHHQGEPHLRPGASATSARATATRSLTLFKDDSAPNQRELARRFTTIDNFYADAEVSADGHNWTTQANATDYVDKTWPIDYSPAPRWSQRAYDFEDVRSRSSSAPSRWPATLQCRARPPAQTVGYLWDNAWPRRLVSATTASTCRSHGRLRAAATSRTPRISTPVRRSRRTGYPGTTCAARTTRQREPAWAARVHAETSTRHAADLPALPIMRLPNDHTAGTRAGARARRSVHGRQRPRARAARQAVSHSSYWNSTADPRDRGRRAGRPRPRGCAPHGRPRDQPVHPGRHGRLAPTTTPRR